jgi:uncharacterized membrane-anchored protein
MKTFKLPVVLALSFIMIFVQTAGYYFSKSLFSLSFSLLIFAFLFEGLIVFAKSFDDEIEKKEDKDFLSSQSKSILLNSGVMFVVGVLIIIRGWNAFLSPKIVNFDLAFNFSLIGAGVFFVILCLLGSEVKTKKEYKPLFIRAAIVLCVALLEITLKTVAAFNFVSDIYIGIAIALIIIIDALVLAIKTIKKIYSRRQMWQ